jgi:DNA-binding MarR family transcriptional regulator
MNQQKRPDYFCFDTNKNARWQQSGVTAQEALALVSLMLKAKKGGVVYATQVELAKEVGCCRPTINKGLKSLISRGLVEKIKGKAGQYRITSSIGTKLA